MIRVQGAKLYVAAVFATCFALRATIGDAPLSADDQQTAGWVLNGICTGLGFIIGPELVEGVRTVVGKLADKPPAS